MATNLLPPRAESSPSLRLGLLEVGLLPDALIHVALDAREVRVSTRVVPGATEPATHAAPRIARAVTTGQPGFVTLEAASPDPVCGVGVHRGRGTDPRP